MIFNGAYLLLIVGGWLAYKLGCWVHDLAERTPNHEIRRQDA